MRKESGEEEISPNCCYSWVVLTFSMQQTWLLIPIESHARHNCARKAVFLSEAIDLENLHTQEGWPFEKSQALTFD